MADFPPDGAVWEALVLNSHLLQGTLPDYAASPGITPFPGNSPAYHAFIPLKHGLVYTLAGCPGAQFPHL